MLRRSRINPKLSAYHQIFGLFDYNKTPLAPLGTKTFVHERPKQRLTHGDHGKIGFVISPAMQHYRHLEFFIPETGGVRTSDMYTFISSKFELPSSAVGDKLTVALEELIKALRTYKDPIPFTDTSIQITYKYFITQTKSNQ